MHFRSKSPVGWCIDHSKWKRKRFLLLYFAISRIGFHQFLNVASWKPWGFWCDFWWISPTNALGFFSSRNSPILFKRVSRTGFFLREVRGVPPTMIRAQACFFFLQNWKVLVIHVKSPKFSNVFKFTGFFLKGSERFFQMEMLGFLPCLIWRGASVFFAFWSWRTPGYFLGWSIDLVFSKFWAFLLFIIINWCIPKHGSPLNCGMAKLNNGEDARRSHRAESKRIRCVCFGLKYFSPMWSAGEELIKLVSAPARRGSEAAHTFLCTEKQQHLAMNEARVLAKLEHPHIIQYEDCYRDSVMVYIVMEYAAHGDLWQVIQTQVSCCNKVCCFPLGTF